ncbi:MAG: NeuD/PglB/VioB family sugar acetyltransferase [Chloroflexota bacterium]
MSELKELHVPLVNANEEEAVLVSLSIVEGQAVSSGDLLAVIETTKSTAEIYAEENGYLVGLMFRVGDVLHAGAVWAYIGDKPDAQDPSMRPWAISEKPVGENEKLPYKLRITEPALALARQNAFDLDALPQDQLVTSTMIQALIRESKTSVEKFSSMPPLDEENKRMLVFGGGGHGRSLIELIRLLKDYEIEGIVDDEIEAEDTVLGLPVLGGKAQLSQLYESGIHWAVNGVGGIGNLNDRLEVFYALQAAGFFCPTVIHPTAFIEESAVIADGVQVFPFAYIGSQANVGFGSIINTSAIVSHNCQLGNIVNLSPGATLAGSVVIGDEVLIGMRATVNLGVHIGTGAHIGNGATVKSDVPDSGIVPAGAVWPLRR